MMSARQTVLRNFCLSLGSNVKTLHINILCCNVRKCIYICKYIYICTNVYIYTYIYTYIYKNKNHFQIISLAVWAGKIMKKTLLDNTMLLATELYRSYCPGCCPQHRRADFYILPVLKPSMLNTGLSHRHRTKEHGRNWKAVQEADSWQQDLEKLFPWI